MRSSSKISGASTRSSAPDSASERLRAEAADAAATASRSAPADLPPCVLILHARDDLAGPWTVALEAAGFRAAAAVRRAGIDATLQRRPDLVVLDASPPRDAAWRLCRRLRTDPRTSLIPVLAALADSRPAEEAAALGAGADDCVPVAIAPRALAERVAAALRRRGVIPSVSDLRVGDLLVSPSRHRVFVGGRPVDGLTYIEFRTLQALSARAGYVLTREQILVVTHGEECRVSERAVDVQIVGLRKKLGPDAPAIESVRGVGYRLSEERTAAPALRGGLRRS